MASGADAVALQDDMELVGVDDVAFDYRVMTAVERGYPVYAAVPEGRPDMVVAGIPVEGVLGDLLGEVDVVVDSTPKRVGAANGKTHMDAGVKAILHGGESHELAKTFSRSS